jgi:hypothetical protein
MVEKKQRCISTHPASFTVMLTSIPTHFPLYIGRVRVLKVSRRIVVAVRSILTKARRFSTYVIDIFLFDLHRSFIVNDMKRIYKKVFKSKKLSLGPIRGPGIATSTSTLITSAADLIPPAPASSCDSDASAQGTADFNVSVSFAHTIFLDIYLLLLDRPLIILESLPRFPLWRLVIFLLYVSGANLVHHITKSLPSKDCPWWPPGLFFDFHFGDQRSSSCKRRSSHWH